MYRSILYVSLVLGNIVTAGQRINSDTSAIVRLESIREWVICRSENGGTSRAVPTVTLLVLHIVLFIREVALAEIEIHAV